MFHDLWLQALCALLLVAIPSFVTWLRTRPDPQFHTKNARLNAAAGAFAAFCLHLVQTRATEQVLDGVVSLLKNGSPAAAIGSYLVGQLGKPMLGDALAGAKGLFGEELSILFASQGELEQHALQQLGLAAVHVASQKLTTTLPDGSKLVLPAPAAAS